MLVVLGKLVLSFLLILGTVEMIRILLRERSRRNLAEVVNHLGCNWHHAYPERLDVVDTPLVASNLARL